MKLITLLFLSYLLTGNSNPVYEFTYASIENTPVSLKTFEGKKILIVNIATQSKDSSQLLALEQLSSLYADSLEIIVFPSNSFQNEPETNSAIKEKLRALYGVHYRIAGKTVVTGEGQLPLFQWLTRKSQNGMMDAPILGDFQKFLINEKGQLVGVFAPAIEPLDQALKNAIETNWK